MILTDKSGAKWVVVPKQWDGTKWVQVPELVFNGNSWVMINHILGTVSQEIMFPFNIDNGFGLVTNLQSLSRF